MRNVVLKIAAEGKQPTIADVPLGELFIWQGDVWMRSGVAKPDMTEDIKRGGNHVVRLKDGKVLINIEVAWRHTFCRDSLVDYGTKIDRVLPESATLTVEWPYQQPQ